MERGVSELNGVQRVEVFLDDKKVIVSFDEGKTNKELIKNTIEDLGYDVQK